MTELELAIELSGDDDAALWELVERHYAHIYKFIRRLASDDETARELTQETLLQVRASAKRFNGHSQFRTWCLRIAYRTYARSRRRKKTLPLSERLEAPSRHLCLEALILSAALSKLSPKLRDAFVLHELNELSVEETAAVMCIPLGTAKARIARARQFLKVQIEKEDSDYVATKIEARNLH